MRAVASHFAPELAPRVSRLLTAAAEAIPLLADLQLVRHESAPELQSTHSLAVWEELAPVMATTVQSTNALISTAQELFPPPPEVDPLDTLDAAFGPNASTAVPEEFPIGDEAELASLVAAVSMGLRGDVARLGERLRNPAVVADPWHLIGDLLEFRGRLRAGIGELIFEVACRVEEVERAQVVPGYQADLDGAVLLRAATTNLAFLMRGHHQRALAATGAALKSIHADVLAELACFARTFAIAALRTNDKRIYFEARARLLRVENEGAQPLDIRQAIDGMASFLDSMTVISRRENLRQHDRAVLANAGRLLEVAQAAHSSADAKKARAQLLGAAHASRELYGRDPALDAWLRAQRQFPVEWLVDAELLVEAERLASLLAGFALA